MRISKPAIIIPLICLAFYQARAQEKTVPKNAGDTTHMKVDSLKAAIVTATLRPHMKGDTLEYNVDHLKMQRNTMVEELLKRLPGLHVDPDGTITYNGEKIQHLLVDGEDIFGADPTMVTRNFDANKIARVQVLDRKSDDALFTGIDNGVRTKTLNLVLKETAKDGYFGRVETGANTDGFYNTNAALAAFKDKEQFTALGIAANTGVVGFSNTSSGAAVTFVNGNADALNASAGTGIPRFDATALHYANTWPGPLNHLVGNYQYSHYSTEPLTSTQTLQTQPGSIYSQQTLSHSVNQQDQHWVYSTYDWAPNTRSAFNFVLYCNNFIGVNKFTSTSNSSINDTLVNNSLRTIRDNTTRMSIGSNLNWRTQIGKNINRVLSLNVGGTKIDKTTNGYVYSINRFYQPVGPLQSTDTVDQRKQITSHNRSISGSINYTQPLWKGAVIALSHTVFSQGDAPLQASFSRGNGKYEEMVDSLSTHFKIQNINQRATLNLQGKAGRLNYTLGGDWLSYSYAQRDLIADTMLRLHYSNWAPRVLLNYNRNQATFLHFDYTGITTQPTLTQLTPTTNNNDPLHITIGNPNLKPGFNQNVKLEFHHFHTWLIDLNLVGGLTSHAISTRSTIDSLGRQVSQPVNVDGDKTAAVNLSLGRSIFGFNAAILLAGTYTRTVDYVNAELSRNDAYTSTAGFTLNRYVADKYSLQLTTNFTFFDQVSSINTSASVRYWTQNHAGAVSLYFFKGFEINTSATYTWTQKTSAFSDNASVLLWNASLSRNFYHDKLVAKFLLNNILNADAGISRTNTGNTNTQSSTNILGRYWIFSLTYHFDKKLRKK